LNETPPLVHDPSKANRLRNPFVYLSCNPGDTGYLGDMGWLGEKY
jgi:hypothetical protein